MAVANPSRTLSGPESDCAAAPPEAVCTRAEQRGLLFVGLFKLSKFIFFVLVGAGAFHLVHRDLGALVMRLIDSLPIDPEGRIVSMVMDKADLIDAHDLRRIGAGALIYAVICLVEGTGLVLRKTWAEYITVILTVLGLPLEVFELTRRATWLKGAALAVNLLILVYLVWLLKRSQKTELQARLRL